MDDDLFEENNMLIARYLNLILSTREVWGTNVRLDPLASFFNDFFRSHNLSDV